MNGEAAGCKCMQYFVSSVLDKTRNLQNTWTCNPSRAEDFSESSNPQHVTYTMRTMSKTKLEGPGEGVLVSRYTANTKCRGSDKSVGNSGVCALSEPQMQQRGVKQSLVERW